MAISHTTDEFNAQLDNRMGHADSESATIPDVVTAIKGCFGDIRTAIVGGPGSDNAKDVLLGRTSAYLLKMGEELASNYRG